MSYSSFYRYISKEDGKYYIRKDGELYLICNTLPEALYERDRFENVGWNWDNYVQLVDTINGYIHITLPPFESRTDYIYEDKEKWIVRGSSPRRKHYGTYYSYDEAKKVAIIYGASIHHIRKAYRIQRRVNGKPVYFGRFKTREEAEKRVKELEANNWEK